MYRGVENYKKPHGNPFGKNFSETNSQEAFVHMHMVIFPKPTANLFLQGHSALYCLCQIIQTVENHSNVALIRGAIFFIGMGLWSPQRVKSIVNYTATTILPTFVNALGCKHHLVKHDSLFMSYS